MNIPLNINFQQILLHLLNFTVLAVGLYLLLYKPVNKFMAMRVAYYTDAEQQANEKMANARLMEQQCEQQLKDIEHTCAQLKTEETKKLIEAKQAMIEQAKGQADQIIADARLEAQAEKTKIVSGARKEIGDMVVTATEKLVATLHNPELDHALYEKFLAIIDGGPGEAS